MKKLLLAIMLLPTLAISATSINFNTSIIPEIKMISATPAIIELNEANHINFNNAFTQDFVAAKQLEASKKCNDNVGSDIYLVLNSPGGSISAGQLLYDTLNALPCKFHTIPIFAASMGYQTVQNLGRRYILPSGTLMSHRASIGGLSGELGGELDSILNLLRANVYDMEIIASNRVGISLSKYRKLIRDELWLTANQAIANNHVDQIILVACGDDLQGTTTKIFNTFFGKVKAKLAKCPIVTGVLSVESQGLFGIDLDVDLIKAKDYLTNKRKYIKTEL